MNQSVMTGYLDGSVISHVMSPEQNTLRDGQKIDFGNEIGHKSMMADYKNLENSIFVSNKRRSTVVRDKKDIIPASPFVPPHLRLFQAISVGRDTSALLDNDLSEGPIVEEIASPASPLKHKNQRQFSDNSPERKSQTTEDESDHALVDQPAFLPALFDILDFNDEEFIASKD
jgi:hypothetical protein